MSNPPRIPDLRPRLAQKVSSSRSAVCLDEGCQAEHLQTENELLREDLEQAHIQLAEIEQQNRAATYELLDATESLLRMNQVLSRQLTPPFASSEIPTEILKPCLHAILMAVEALRNHHTDGDLTLQQKRQIDDIHANAQQLKAHLNIL